MKWRWNLSKSEFNHPPSPRIPLKLDTEEFSIIRNVNYMCELLFENFWNCKPSRQPFFMGKEWRLNFYILFILYFSCITIFSKKSGCDFKPFKRQSHKMVKHSSNSLATADDCLSLFDHFVGFTLKGSKKQTLKPRPFQANVPFLYPLTTSESQRFCLT